MNLTTITAADVPTLPGTPIGGGFFAGVIRIGGTPHMLIVSPKSAEFNAVWGERGKQVPGASSCFDSLANTRAMAEAGSEAAQRVLALNVDGYADWAIPARDALELLYRNLKPTADENSCSFRDGDNPSSIPAGYPYTEASPTLTVAEAFREGSGEQALESSWHWSSTQDGAYGAWGMGFAGGTTVIINGKDHGAQVRPVRTVPIQ